MSDGARWSNHAGREIRRRAVALRNSEHKIAFCRSAVDVERMRYFYHLPGCCYGHSIDRQNIADFRLGRVAEGKTAISLVSLDAPLADEVFAKVEALPQISQAKRLSF